MTMGIVLTTGEQMEIVVHDDAVALPGREPHAAPFEDVQRRQHDERFFHRVSMLT